MFEILARVDGGFTVHEKSSLWIIRRSSFYEN